jgi:hypothetical protein
MPEPDAPPLREFADRGVLWLLESPENLCGLLRLVAAEIADRLDFSRVNTPVYEAAERRQEEIEAMRRTGAQALLEELTLQRGRKAASKEGSVMKSRKGWDAHRH